MLGRASDHLCVHGRRNVELTEQPLEQAELVNLGECDERRGVGDDDHAGASASRRAAASNSAASSSSV